jgi:hypothetical protein
MQFYGHVGVILDNETRDVTRGLVAKTASAKLSAMA